MKKLSLSFLLILSFGTSAKIIERLNASSLNTNYSFYNVETFSINNDFTCSAYIGQTDMKLIATASDDGLNIRAINHENGTEKTLSGECKKAASRVLNESNQLQDNYLCHKGLFRFWVPLYNELPYYDVWDGSTGVVDLRYRFEGLYDRPFPFRNVEVSCIQKAKYESVEEN